MAGKEPKPTGRDALLAKLAADDEPDATEEQKDAVRKERDRPLPSMREAHAVARDAAKTHTAATDELTTAIIQQQHAAALVEDLRVKAAEAEAAHVAAQADLAAATVAAESNR